MAFISEDKRSQKVQLGPKIEITRIPRKRQSTVWRKSVLLRLGVDCSSSMDSEI